MRRCTSRQADQPMFDSEYPRTRCERAFDGDFHLAALESGRRTFLRFLRKKPYVHQLRGRLVDLAGLAKRFLQNADGLAHIVGGNSRHRA